MLCAEIESMMNRPPQGNPEKVSVLVVAGVCGSGKTSVAERVAQHFGSDYLEGDDLHPVENKEMMRRGQPLDDAHRFPWLRQIAAAVQLKAERLISSGGKRRVFVTCSALKRIYRAEIERCLPADRYEVVWVFLKIDDKEKLRTRVSSRSGHFMNPNLVQSQFDALEVPNASVENVIELSVDDVPVEQTVQQLIDSINRLNY